MNRIFLSHSSADNESALALSRWLAQNGWDDHFLDLDPKRGIAAGERWLQAFMGSLSRCEAVIFLLSPAWCRSRYCRTELDAAKGHGKRLFGVMVEPVALEDVAELSTDWQVCDLTGASETTHESIEIGPPLHPARQTVSFGRKGLESLAIGLRRAGLDPGSFPWPPAHDPGRRPYRGLRALDRDDAAVFFGRDAAIVKLLDRLQQMRQLGTQNLLVILGASGAGKSSFLRAGLLPRLERDSERYVVLPTVRPEVAVLSGDQGLLSALGQALADAGQPVAPADLQLRLTSQGLSSDFDTLAQPTPALVREAQVLGLLAARRTVILPVDQAEELFSSDRAAVAEFTRFCDMLAELRRNTATRGSQTEPAFIVVLTIRSDTLPTLQACPPLMGLSPALESLEPMPATEFKSVVDGPARRHSAERFPVRVEAALSERLIAESEGADALPLLALTLEALYAQHERPDHRTKVLGQPPAIELKLGDYDILGGVRKVIAGAVARAFAKPDEIPPIPSDTAVRDTALHALFALLATVDPLSHKARRVVATAEDIARIPHGPALVARLEEQRLLVRDRRSHDGQASVEVIEVAHEALMRQWERFDAWLTEQQARLIVVEGVRRAATEWLQAERSDVLLVHASSRLRDAEDLRQDTLLAPRLAGDAGEYLEACLGRQRRIDREREIQLADLAAAQQERESAVARQAAQQKLTARVQRRLLLVLAAGLLVVSALAVWTIAQSRNAARQTSAVLADASRRAADREDIPQASRLALLSMQQGRGSSWLMPSHDSSFPALVRAAAGARLEADMHHDGTVNGVQFNLDGRRVLTCSDDATAQIWDTRTGLPIGAPMRHESKVLSAQFSSDGHRVVTASNTSAHLWDVTTGRPVGEPLRHMSKLVSAQFSPDSKLVLTVSEDWSAQVWDVKRGQPIGLPMSHQGEILSAQFSSDSQQVLTGSDDRTAQLWDVMTGRRISIEMHHTGPVLSAQFSPVDHRILTASLKSARLWDAKTGKTVGNEMRHEGPVLSAQFSPDGHRILTASNASALLWDAKTGQPIGNAMLHKGMVDSAHFSPDGQRVVTASGMFAQLWDSETGKPIGYAMHHEGNIKSVQFSPDGKLVVTASHLSARLWDSKTGQKIGAPKHSHDVVHSAQFSPDSKQLVTASADHTARLWDAKTGQQIGDAMRHDGRVLSAQFSPDDLRIVTASVDGTARLWHATTSRPIGAAMRHEGAVRSAEFSPDSQRVVTVSADNTARLWDAKTGNPIGSPMLHEADVFSAQFSPDSQVVVTASADKSARLWDAGTGQPIGAAMRHEGTVLSAKFSLDGQRLVTASDDGTARLWHAPTGRPIGAAMRHEGIVTSAKFSPDSQRVVTASQDNTARLWDAKTGQPIGTAMRHEGAVLSAEFSPDGLRVVTGSFDNTARIWHVRTNQPIGAALHQVGTVQSAHFSPDDQLLVTVTSYGGVQLWDASWTPISSGEVAQALACRHLPGKSRLVSLSDVHLAAVIDAGEIGKRDVCREVVP